MTPRNKITYLIYKVDNSVLDCKMCIETECYIKNISNQTGGGKYPNITDDEFYDKINKIYKNYRVPKNRLTADQYCKPKEFKLQPPQKFVSSYIHPNTPYQSLLIYHRIGAGKTCSAIQIAERWKNKKRIVFVLPAALKGNFRNELRGQCGSDNYLKPSERKKLELLEPGEEEYNDIISRSDKRIDKYYDIYSYNKFIDNAKDGIKLNNSILIIDEIQNMVSETGMYYRELYDLINRSSKNLRIILLSATPMFDKPVEIALTINLLKPETELPTGKDFDNMFITERVRNDKMYYDVKNMDKFKSMIKGYVSYYKGAPSFTFPEMKVKYMECEMSDFQYDIYKKVLRAEDGESLLSNKPSKEIVNASDLPNNFFLGTRFVSNVVFPNKKVGDAGLESFTPKRILKHLDRYSCKFDKIMYSVNRSRGKVFIYSGFKQHAGLESLVQVLEAFGYKNYVTHGVGRKRYAVWSGDVSTDVKDRMREVYNRADNLYGNKLKIILGSPSIKEGVSLKAVRYVHVIEPYWNQSRLEQVIGRASRFCSHIALPEEKRNVKVYIYIATHPDIDMTVDQHIRKLSETKNKIIRKFEEAIREAAVDCRLNKNANEIEGDLIRCE
jgi:superfamily II DNA or RNA helicase